MLSKILKDRNKLPEFCTFAMKVNLKEKSSKKKTNKMIDTLIHCGFIIRMFQAVEDEHVFYLTFDMTQIDLEKSAQE